MNYLISRPALNVAGAWVFLPPYGLSVAVQETHFKAISFIPLAPVGSLSWQVPISVQTGWMLDVTFAYRKDTIYDGYAWQLAFRQALTNPTTFAGRTVDFCRFIGLPGIYRSCVCPDGGEPVFDNAVPGSERFRSCKFQLQSLDPGLYTTATDGTAPPASDYETDLFAGEPDGLGGTVNAPGVNGGSGQAGGSGTGGGTTTIGGGSGIVPIDQVYVAQAQFVGLAEVTAAGNAALWQYELPIYGSGSSMKIAALELRAKGGNQGGAVATTVKISNQAYNNQTGATTITNTIAGGASNSAAPVTGAIPIVLSSGIGVAYIFITTAGGHADLTAFAKVVSP